MKTELVKKIKADKRLSAKLTDIMNMCRFDDFEATDAGSNGMCFIETVSVFGLGDDKGYTLTLEDLIEMFND